VLHLLYGRLTRARRRWYERRPSARRRLARPVVSVGNLTVGGAGKTPLVAALARWLIEAGERPAILSRGYGRRTRTAEPLVVADGTRVLAAVDAAGDEPLMLARAVPGAIVVVGADRAASGAHAERALGATVHVLDDGFQHVRLERDLDIVVTQAGALAADAVLPKGRLREPLDALQRASLLVVIGADAAAAEAEGRRYGVPLAIAAVRRLEAPVALHDGPPPPGARVVALAAIGQPAQFGDGLRAAGWDVVATHWKRDHHWYARADLDAVAALVRRHQAWGVLTTDKDAVRLEALAPWPCAIARVPLRLEVPRWAVLTNAVRTAMARRRQTAGPVVATGGPA
jgi:tetraacyldisaccharide 4'-kinase